MGIFRTDRDRGIAAFPVDSRKLSGGLHSGNRFRWCCFLWNEVQVPRYMQM